MAERADIRGPSADILPFRGRAGSLYELDSARAMAARLNVRLRESTSAARSQDLARAPILDLADQAFEAQLAALERAWSGRKPCDGEGL